MSPIFVTKVEQRGTVMSCDLEEGEIAGDVEPVDSSRSSPIVAEDLLVLEPLVRPRRAESLITSGATTAEPDTCSSRAPPALYSSDSDSDDDSESGRRWWKRCRGEANGYASSRNRCVWSNVLTEDQLSGTLDSCSNITERGSIQVERDVESYRLPSAELLSNYYKQFRNPKLLNGTKQTDKHTKRKHRPNSKRPPSHDHGTQSRDGSNLKRSLSDAKREWRDAMTRPVEVLPLSVSEECPSEQLASDIAVKLGEDKVKLIGEVVRVLGPVKARAVFEQTRSVQRVGGMMVNDGSRRRTSGGVFFQLLRTDPEVSEQMAKEMFREEVRESEMVKRRIRRVKRRARKSMEKQLKSENNDCKADAVSCDQ